MLLQQETDSRLQLPVLSFAYIALLNRPIYIIHVRMVSG
jgi:hypothetical protein